MPLPSYFAEERRLSAHNPDCHSMSREDALTLQGDAYAVHQLIGAARVHLERIGVVVQSMRFHAAAESELGQEVRRLETLVNSHRSVLAAIDPAADWVASNLDPALWTLKEAAK